jgi:murein DD-endopeptidase MepM/ murein hydrolase activator NlpD
MGRRGAGAGLILVALASGCAHGRGDADLRWAWHRVRAGETLSGIAARYRVAEAALAEANALTDPDLVREGELLYVPLDGAAADPRARGRGVTHFGRASRTLSRSLTAKPADAGGPLAWPVQAAISSRFGTREGRPHEGIDLAVGDGTEVRAAAAGRVVYAGSGVRGYGNLVVVQHADGLTTLYAHNSQLLVAEGAEVARGEVISLSGHSGRATAPHLHFEVRMGEVARDPERYLAPAK